MTGARPISLDIPDVKILAPQKHGDRRGFFCELYNRKSLPGINFVQDNLSVSAQAGTVRGLHYQEPPHAQTKLVSVLRGAVFDVAVDIRKNSPTFGRWVGVELTETNFKQLLIPAGFAHGYCTLVPDTMVFYKVDAFYAPSHDRGILWNDPAIGIAWPASAGNEIVSEKDRTHPPLADADTPFTS
jgi:dTDP-4-dehydrorhamnose 3,5-epimerase